MTVAPPRYDPPQRVVVKIGSSSLTAADGGLDTDVVGAVCDQLAELVGRGTAVVLVSSGAVAAGLRPLGLRARPTDLGRLQAAASVGQGALVHAYTTALARHGLPCGQVLLTPDDVIDRRRYLNARTTFSELLRLGAVPVVNENDTVVTDELRFGDNDRLAALVASMLGATLLILLSDVEGLHDGDPATGAPVIDTVQDLAMLGERHRGGSASAVGTGGMASKLEAARIATFSAAHCVIARGRRSGAILDVVAGAPVGTWFPPAAKRPDSRRLWLAFAHQPAGSLHVDAGAVRALTEQGASLLAIGITESSGDFAAGEAVDVVGPDGHSVARGVVAFDSATVAGMIGLGTQPLIERKGESGSRPVVHRDPLVVTV